MTQAEDTKALVTDDPEAFRETLWRGDVLVYDSLGIDAGLVQWGDRVPANHASLVLDRERLIEANRVDDEHPHAVRTVSISDRLRVTGVRTITALRHQRVVDAGRSGDALVQPVLDRALSQLNDGEFSYLQIVALAPACLRRNYPNDFKGGGLLTQVMDILLQRLALLLEPVVSRPDPSRLTCSEYVYRCFAEAAGGELPIIINGPVGEAQSWPAWMTPEQIALFTALYESLGGKGGSLPGALGVDPAESATPGDLWRSPSLLPIAAYHRPPERPVAPVEFGAPGEDDEL
jgi:hypothetical protein